MLKQIKIFSNIDAVTPFLISSLLGMLILLPLSLGIAHSSNASHFAGLMSAIVGTVLVGLLSKSPVGISGPAIGITIIYLSAMESLGSFSNVQTSLVLAGFFQMLMGFWGWGNLAFFAPRSLIKGLISAIGIVLIWHQISHVLGFHQGEMIFNDRNIMLETKAFQWVNWNLGSGIIGISSLLFLSWAEKKYKNGVLLLIPYLSVFVFGIILKFVFDSIDPLRLSSSNLVSLPLTEIQNDFRFGKLLPDLAALWSFKTYLFALLFAALLTSQSLLSWRAIQLFFNPGKDILYNRELIAQGLGNLVLGLIGGFPISVQLVSTSLQVHLGLQSRWSIVCQGLILLFLVYFFAFVFSMIPISTVAAVLIFLGLYLFRFQELIKSYKQGTEEFSVFMLTFLACIFGNFLLGILMGSGLSLIFSIRRTFQHNSLRLQKTGSWYRLILNHSTNLLHMADFIRSIKKIPENSFLEIDATQAEYIDPEIKNVIKDLRKPSSQQKVEIMVAGIPEIPQVSEKFSQQIDAKYFALLKQNRDFVLEKTQEDPHYFSDLLQGQEPDFLIISCSDSRVPMETLTKARPGQIFMHRNIANCISLHDFNFLSVLQYSVEVLKVKHIIICGHYQCGGVKAAISRKSFGLIDHWISSIKTTILIHSTELERITDPEKREARTIELHAIEQLRTIYKTSIVQKSIEQRGFPFLHAWVYDLGSGYIKNLDAELGYEKGELKDFIHSSFKYIED